MHTTHVPYTKVFLHDVHSIGLAADGHIQVLDSLTGSVLYSTKTTAELTEKVQKSGAIVAAVVDANLNYLVTATSDKSVRVWQLPALRIVSERETPKKPTDLCLTHDAQTIIVSDKFGDVHRYPLLVSDKAEVENESSTSGDIKSKSAAKRLEDQALLLGHVSLLTAVLLSKDEKYIITADRDEHIRVSWYPEAYTIERYCLGHKKFVSALHIPSWDPDILISGGGDPVLKVWDWMEGKALHDIPVADAVLPFVKVTRKKAGRGEDDSDGEGGGGDVEGRSRRKRKNKKKQSKGDAEPITEPDAKEENQSKDEADDMQVDEQPVAEIKSDNALAGNSKAGYIGKEETSQASPLLAIQKISTLESGPNKFLIFSAHGATALFYCKLPEDPGPSPEIRSLALNKPVLDFIQWPKTDEIWVSVDGDWSEATSSTNDDSRFIRIAKVAGDEIVLSDDTTHQSLASSLSTTSRLEASEDSLKMIDLYSALVILPKNVDAEHNAMDVETQFSEAVSGKLSGKELGRLKSKKAILARQPTPSNKREEISTADEVRNLKRQKSESEGDVK